MRIGELAAKSGLSTKAIRFYEGVGVLPKPPRTNSGYREYGPDFVERLTFIRRAQTAGLTLQQTREVLNVADSGDSPCSHVEQLLNSRLADVQAKIRELNQLAETLSDLLVKAGTTEGAEPSAFCPILDSAALDSLSIIAPRIRS